ncbi:MAG: hypothetical protein R2792_14985 [Saprospiraceae bacterium]
MYSVRLYWLFLCVFLTAQLAAQSPVKSPDAYLPHKLGEQFTPHHMLNSYFAYLASQTSQTCKLEQYGMTNEDRPLQIAIFSSRRKTCENWRRFAPTTSNLPACFPGPAMHGISPLQLFG